MALRLNLDWERHAEDYSTHTRHLDVLCHNG